MKKSLDELENLGGKPIISKEMEDKLQPKESNDIGDKAQINESNDKEQGFWYVTKNEHGKFKLTQNK